MHSNESVASLVICTSSRFKTRIISQENHLKSKSLANDLHVFSGKRCYGKINESKIDISGRKPKPKQQKVSRQKQESTSLKASNDN